MATFYFAEDGNWGSASDLILIDEDDYKFTDAMWELISDSGDNSRLSIVEHFKGVADGDEEHVWIDHTDNPTAKICGVCELTEAEVN